MGATMSEHQPIAAHFRVRAAFYRQRAVGISDPTKADEYRYLADVFDREAVAFEKIKQQTAESVSLKRCSFIVV